jgi:Leucine-rich repeat (LRR) protein
VLWLADNYISSIQGISQLTSLQQLNLARNDVALIGSSLQQNSGLTSLNMADNQISSLQVRCTYACVSAIQDHLTARQCLP